MITTWTTNDCEKAEKLRAAGTHYGAIAISLQRTAAGIRNHFRRCPIHPIANTADRQRAHRAKNPQTAQEAIARLKDTINELKLRRPLLENLLAQAYESLSAIDLDNDKQVEQLLHSKAFQVRLLDTTTAIANWVIMCQTLTRTLERCPICANKLPDKPWWQYRQSPYCSWTCRKQAHQERLDRRLRTYLEAYRRQLKPQQDELVVLQKGMAEAV